MCVGVCVGVGMGASMGAGMGRWVCGTQCWMHGIECMDCVGALRAWHVVYT